MSDKQDNDLNANYEVLPLIDLQQDFPLLRHTRTIIGMEKNNEAEQKQVLIQQKQADSPLGISMGTSSTQEHPISDVEKNSLMQVLNAKRIGWGRPQLTNGQPWEHYEPTSLEMIVFLVRFGLYQRGYQWNHEYNFGSKVLEMRDPWDEFETYPLQREDPYGPTQEGGAVYHRDEGSSSGVVSLSTAPHAQRTSAVLPRPCGPYNRFVYHAVACILYMYDDQYLKRQVGINLQGDGSIVQRMLSEEYMIQFRDRFLNPEINWLQIMKALGFLGALGYQCKRVKRYDMMDGIAQNMERIFFEERINPWLADHGGWVGLYSAFLQLKGELSISLPENYFSKLILRLSSSSSSQITKMGAHDKFRSTGSGPYARSDIGPQGSVTNLKMRLKLSLKQFKNFHLF